MPSIFPQLFLKSLKATTLSPCKIHMLPRNLMGIMFFPKSTPCSSYSLLHIPLHTHQLPWPAFCEFLGIWNAEPELEEKMKKMGKAYKNPRTPKQQTSFFVLPVTGLCFPAHKSKPGYPSCLRCFIVLLCCGR